MNPELCAVCVAAAFSVTLLADARRRRWRQRQQTGGRVRSAASSDHGQLVCFTQAIAFETEGGLLLPPADVHRGVAFLLHSSDDGLRPHCWVWEEDGGVVGMVSTSPEWSDWWGCEYWWVLTIYVAPAYRRRGIARALLAEVVAAAARDNVQTVNLRVERDNSAAQALYRDVGFAVDDSHLVMACGRTPSGKKVGT